ncbi:MAG: M81 family metallopeptidase [Caldilineaceae bacterium]
MRIAIAGISNENSNFSPIPNRLADFSLCWRTKRCWRLIAIHSPAGFPRCSPSCPLSLPGRCLVGRLPPDAYRRFKHDIRALAQMGSVDGVYLDLHGRCMWKG